jgi:GTP-binding protein
VLIDSRHEAQRIDLEFVNSLGTWQVPFVLLFTKIDKNKPGAVKRNVEDFLHKMEDNWEEHPPYFLTSALNRTGREEILAYIAGLNRSFTRL